jgi:hypothetical protein
MITIISKIYFNNLFLCLLWRHNIVLPDVYAYDMYAINPLAYHTCNIYLHSYL